jgi:hypothetical protein
MAAPHVAGLAAILWSKNPSWTNEEIRNAIKSSTDDLGSTGKDNYFGYGRINALKALSLAEPILVDINNSSVELSATEIIAGENINAQILLKDVLNDPLVGYEVVVTSSVGSDTIANLPLTNDQGATSTSISPTTSGIRTITVTDKISNLVLANTQVTVLPASLHALQISVSKEKIMPITLNYSLVTITAVDLYGNRVSGININLESSRGETDSIEPALGVTDINGRFVSQVKSNTLGNFSVSAISGGINSNRSLKVVKAGDLNDDTQINVYDASVLMASWGIIVNPLPDINSDGIVNIYDASILMSNWNK